MARWEPDAPGRLQRAAMQLYGERGYEQTTVAEIAAAAGVTERTFFRHFADKREVFFHGTRGFEELWADAVTAAPADATPAQAAITAVDAAAQLLETRREIAPVRQRILDANPELNERELAKLGRVRSAVAGALRERGAQDPAAGILAGAAVAVFYAAFERWIYGADPRTLPVIARASLAEMVSLLGDTGDLAAPAHASAPLVATATATAD